MYYSLEVTCTTLINTMLFFVRVDVFRLTVLMQFKSFFYLLFQLFSCIP